MYLKIFLLLYKALIINIIINIFVKITKIYLYYITLFFNLYLYIRSCNKQINIAVDPCSLQNVPKNVNITTIKALLSV